MSIMLGMTGVYSDGGLQRVNYTKLEELEWFLAPSFGEEGRYSPSVLAGIFILSLRGDRIEAISLAFDMKRLY